MNETLVKWIKRDADYFVGTLKETKEALAEARANKSGVPIECYYRGKITTLEGVLRVVFKPYLELLAQAEEEKEASDAADYADHLRDEARDEEALRQLNEQ